MTSATAVAGTNIALVKYWGKRDAALNLPAAGSLSLTLDRLGTRTRVAFDGGDGGDDRVLLDGAPAGEKFAARVSGFLDRIRTRAGITARASVETSNSVPTAAGLASSASGFAALAAAAARAADLVVVARRAVGAGASGLRLGGAIDLRRLRRDGGRHARRRARRGRAARRGEHGLGGAPGRRHHGGGRKDHRLDGSDVSHRRRPRRTTRPGCAASTTIWRPRARPSWRAT